ncbi:MAG TPA: DUF2892 domain-containing protein [Thermodesulfovibrionia bacterium]|nr:DUF2892 domain-containing protein [Thermodesulfovibrionia bacterium]
MEQVIRYVMPIERWIRFIVGFEATAYSVLAYTHSLYWTFPMMFMGWTLLQSFVTNCTPLMLVFWSMGATDERPCGARDPWIFGKGTVMYIERWTRLLAGMAYFIGGLMAYFHSPYWLYATTVVGFVQFQGSVTNWCPSLAFMKYIGVKDEKALNKQIHF